MNIFYLSSCPVKAARMQIDKHVNKMIVESAQMLANVYSNEQLVYAPKSQKGNVRKHSYYNHPCSVWVRQSRTNFDWLLEHAVALVLERRWRFSKDHFSFSFLTWCKMNQPDIIDVGLTKPAQAFKKGVWDHLIDEDPVRGYQRYYVADKHYDNKGRDMLSYTKRQIPAFWEKYYKEFYA